MTKGQTHGGSYTAEYNSWAHIHRRTRINAKERDRRNYYDRGIKVCDRWTKGDGNRSAFECFLADMGKKPSPAHSVDRINNDGNYEPSNCKWSTPKEQSRNQRKTKMVDYKGCRYRLRDAAEQFASVSVSRVYQRIYLGWSVEDAIETPNIGNGRQR